MALPVGSIGDEAHEATGNEASNGNGDEPTHVDPADHAPVDRTPVTVAETNTDNGTSDALSSRDGKLCVMVSMQSWQVKFKTYLGG